MIIKVKHEELDTVAEKMEKNENAFNHEIDEMLNNLEILREIWQGEDSDKFYENAKGYFTKMKLLPITMASIGGIIKLSNGRYKEKDKEYSKKYEKEVEDIKNPKNPSVKGVIPYEK